MRIQRYRAEPVYFEAYTEKNDCSTRPYRGDLREEAYPLGKLIHRARRRLNLGLRQFSYAVRLSPTFISRLETGQHPTSKMPSEESLKRISDVLGIPHLALLQAAHRLPERLASVVYDDPDTFRLLEVMSRRKIPAKAFLALVEEAAERTEAAEEGEGRPRRRDVVRSQPAAR